MSKPVALSDACLVGERVEKSFALANGGSRLTLKLTPQNGSEWDADYARVIL
jgi:hypothetical protein